MWWVGVLGEKVLCYGLVLRCSVALWFGAMRCGVSPLAVDGAVS